jgi:hypothetical protein
MNEDPFPWAGPPCPQCGAEMEPSPISSGSGIRVAYVCEAHGLMTLADPFEA